MGLTYMMKMPGDKIPINWSPIIVCTWERFRALQKQGVNMHYLFEIPVCNYPMSFFVFRRGDTNVLHLVQTD